MITFTANHPKITPANIHDIIGYIPFWLDESDMRSAAEQLNSNYIGGWSPFPGFRADPDHTLHYPGDPPIRPLATAQFRDETIVMYAHAWVAIFQPDGSFEVCRMD